MPDSYNLQRFLDAQSGVYEQVVTELKRGRKASHWIWFIFPQIAGLGHSSMAQRYAVTSIAEARAYLEHPLLGLRLRECAEMLLMHAGTDVDQIMGYPDDLKLKSSMTLFARAAEARDKPEEQEVFNEVLDTFYVGELDEHTLALL